jgi:hypothetical protein
MLRVKIWQSNTDRLPILATELVRRPVAVIVALGSSDSLCSQGGNNDDIGCVYER